MIHKSFFEQLIIVLLGISIATTAHGKFKVVNAILTTETLMQDPLTAKGYQQFQVINLVLDTLVKKDPKVGLVSGIAKRWTVSEDQKTYTFFLAEKARFQNNESIKADDVLYSFNRHLAATSGSAIRSYLSNILLEIAKIDENTVRFTLKGPYPPFLELLTMPGFGIISQKSTDKNIIGSGPYIFESTGTQTWCLKKDKKYPFTTTNIDQYCFRIERDIVKSVNSLNTQEINLAMGSPLEVALSTQLKLELVANPTFSLVSTHIFLNHSNPFLKKLKNRKLVADIARFARSEKSILTKFDSSLDTYLPLGVMPESYYKKALVPKSLPKVATKEKLKIIFPYGIFLESAVEKIVATFKSAGFDVTYKNVKGKDLLQPIIDGDFDLVFIPYQGVISDPDGYLEMLNPNSVLSKAEIPSLNLLKNLEEARFIAQKNDRLKKYQEIFLKWEEDLNVIPFSQNSIPIVFNKEIKLPDLNYSFHLNLRELSIADEK